MTIIDYITFEMNSILQYILIIPLFTLLLIIIIAPLGNRVVYNVSLTSMGISFIFSILLWFFFDGVSGGFQQTYHVTIIPSFLADLRLGVDGISIFFVILTNLFLYLCVFSLNKTTENLVDTIFHLLFLQWSVLASFLFIDILGFFLFFEMTLIPIYFLVLFWGSRERRVRASYMISIYTLLGSIFLFFNLLYIYSKTGSTDYEVLLNVQLSTEDQIFIWLTFFLSFAAKIPLFPLHIWLPEAHVEAPTLGSVLLAVLLLKLGTYGMIRFSIPFLPEGTIVYSGIVVLFAILGIVYTCMTAIRQIDLKKIIAYSSVGHMNVVLLGIIAMTSEALQGSIFQMLSHGVVSGALFFSVGSLYSRYSVRSLKYFGGLVYLYPWLAVCFFIFSLANISFPLTSSFVGEFLILMGFFKHSFWGTFFASTSMVLGAVYTLWTFNRIFFGNIKVLSVIYYKDLEKKEIHLFLILFIVLMVMGITPYILLDDMLVDCLNVIEHAKITNA